MKRRNRIKLGFRRTVARAFVLAPLTFLLVAGAGCPSLFESPTHRVPQIRQAVVGKDGARTVTTAGTVVNAYAALRADVVAGATSVTFDNADANFGVLAEGDLVLIIQMQGATINATDTSAYGTVTDAGGAGQYEFVGVESVSGNQINLACRLKNAYTVAGKTQIVRVPQYTTLTIANGASITAPSAVVGGTPTGWNGTTGGVVAVHAESTVTLNGSATIDVSGQGFRGGAVDNSSGALNTSITLYRSDAAADGAEKGESIAGYRSSYPNGRYYGRGAPANGGGGGNSHNAGGGGGANAASGLGWSGHGVMTGCTPASPGAWALDNDYTSNPATNKCANSEGGGRGGYTFSYAAQNPTTVAPGSASWGGNSRQQVGGLGGRPVPIPNNPGGTDPRLFIGGGGGAGDGNSSHAGRGGHGGGLVFLIAGQVTGTGSILAQGEAGANATATTGVWNDAPGGGGGGGTIVVSAATVADTISINADGGPGGNHAGGFDANEVEGPGGGGGGGYIAVTSGSGAALSAGGGLAGTTNQTIMSSFAQNGATAGNAGVTNGSAARFLYCGDTLATTLVNKPPRYANAPNAIFTFENPVSPVTYQCRFYPAGTAPLPAWSPCTGVDAGADGFTVVGLPDGTYTLNVQATDAYGNVETPPVTYTWTIDTVPPTTQFAAKPPESTTITTGVFVFQPSETPVTYACKLDGAAQWTACNPGDLSNPNYSTGTLGLGHHTLSVQATDIAGNVEVDPRTWAWDVIATGLDGGAPDVELLDVERADVERKDVEDDLRTALDVVLGPDVEKRDDAPIVVTPDVAKRDVAGSDRGVAPILDTQVLDVQRDDVAAVDLRTSLDLQLLDVEKDDVPPLVNQDTGPLVNEDTAPLVNEDTAAPVAQEDAAAPPLPEPPNVEVLGGGFCTIAPAGSASPAAFLLLAMAGLALLRRKRR